MIFDLTETVERSSDPAALGALLGALIGQPCLKADLSYGNELMLHVGDPVPYSHPKLSDESKGSWILGTRASGWRLLLSDPALIIASGPLPNEPWLFPPFVPGWKSAEQVPISNEEIERKAATLRGKPIVGVHPLLFPVPPTVTPHGFSVGLIVAFAGGSNLVVAPSPEPDEGDDHLPDWEMFTPYHTYLRVGPGPVWSYLPSDKLVKAAS